jgi:hypothetical protein
MSPHLVRLLVAVYPRSWRDRYEEEFVLFLQARPLTLAAFVDILRWAIYERIAALHKVFAVDQRQQSLVWMAYAYLAAVAAGINFFWTVADTPMAIAMRTYSALRASWLLVSLGSAVAFCAVMMVVVPGVLTILRWAWTQGRRDVLARLAVPPAAAILTLAWMAAAWRFTGGHWVPTPWDVAGDWAAPTEWPPLETRWVLGLVTGVLFVGGFIVSAQSVRVAIDRSNLPRLRGAWFTASSVLLATGATAMAGGVLAWGWFAEQYAASDFHARNGGFFNSTNIASWAVSGIIFIAATTVAVRAARVTLTDAHHGAAHA